jgi:MipA family protein
MEKPAEQYMKDAQKTPIQSAAGVAMALMTLQAAWADVHADGAQPYKAEVGIGVAVIRYPAYRGSDQNSTLALPFPYVEYRGDFVKADREGVRGSLFDSERFELTVSVSGSPPTKSEGIARRQGMPDLKPSIELGPQFSALLTSPSDKSVTLRLRLPLRQAVVLSGKGQNAGLTFSPNLNLDIANPFHWHGANMGVVIGALFANKKQNNYFYTVDPVYATPSRPAYQAGSGYAGSQLLVSLSKKTGNTWLGAYVRYDMLKGASFEDSPLVATRRYVTAGVASSYIFAKF